MVIVRSELSRREGPQTTTTVEHKLTGSRQCDESKPICKRCKAYGVVCSYDKKSPDLQLSNDASFYVSILNDPPARPRAEAVPKSIAPSLKQGLAASLESYASHDLTHSEFELLHRFQTRTVYTVTTPRSITVYQSSILKYACSVCTQKPMEMSTNISSASVPPTCSPHLDTSPRSPLQFIPKLISHNSRSLPLGSKHSFIQQSNLHTDSPCITRRSLGHSRFPRHSVNNAH